MLPVFMLSTWCAGHVLVSPVRVVPRFKDLTVEEVADMWLLAKRVAACVEHVYKADALNLAMQVCAPACAAEMTCCLCFISSAHLLRKPVLSCNIFHSDAYLCVWPAMLGCMLHVHMEAFTYFNKLAAPVGCVWTMTSATWHQILRTQR
jgi:hypothetical protein